MKQPTWRSNALTRTTTRTFTLDPAQAIFGIEHYKGHIPSTVLDIAERFFQIPGPESADLRTHAHHDASIIDRLVLNIYDQEPLAPKLARRALDLIDEMIMAAPTALRSAWPYSTDRSICPADARAGEAVEGSVAGQPNGRTYSGAVQEVRRDTNDHPVCCRTSRDGKISAMRHSWFSGLIVCARTEWSF